MECVKFPDKPTIWLHGYDRDGEFFHDLTADNDLHLTATLPLRMLAAGDDDLDARFHRCTGL